MNNTQKNELLDLAADLVFQTLKFSPLWDELENFQLDELTEKLTPRVLEYVVQLVDSEVEKGMQETA